MLNLNLPSPGERTTFWLRKLWPILAFLALFLIIAAIAKCAPSQTITIPQEQRETITQYVTEEIQAGNLKMGVGHRLLLILGYILAFVSALTVLIDLLGLNKSSPRRVALAALGFLMGTILIEPQPWGAVAIAVIALGALLCSRSAGGTGSSGNRGVGGLGS